MNVNSIISSQNEHGMFVTILCAILDTETGELQIGNAGHNPPLIGKRNGQGCEFITLPESIVLAPLEDVKFSSVTVMLKPDDVVFFYTDGITEAMNPKEELFTGERLRTTLSSLKGINITEIACAVRDEVKNYAQEAPQSDDIDMKLVTEFMILMAYPFKTLNAQPAHPANVYGYGIGRARLFCIKRHFTDERSGAKGP